MKVLNFGSLNIDYVYDVKHIAREGETLQSQARTVYCGGKGLNQSIALKKAGIDVYQAGAVGSDDSDILIEMLEAWKISHDYVLRKAMPSGHAIIQRDQDGKNSILLFGGANLAITKSEIDTVLSNFEAGDLLVLQNEISEMAYLMQSAAELGMGIVFNPSPYDDGIRSYPLSKLKYLILNEHEAKALCDFEGDEEAHMRALHARYPEVGIVLTLGERGVMYQDAGQAFKIPAERVTAVDTTAAGDTFTGYFLAAILRSFDVSTALKLATKASAIAVTRAGAAPSIPMAEEVF